MRLRTLACSTIWLAHAVDGFINLPLRAIDAAPFLTSRSAISAIGGKPPSPDELRARAAAIREELKELEASAAGTRRPNVEFAEQRTVVPLPETLLDSCWKVVLEIRGVKSNKNRVPIRLTFCCKFSTEDYILEVEPNHRFVKRGYVWEPDRNEGEDKEFITFIAQVEGLSAVPDGRIYMNAFIDTVEDVYKAVSTRLNSRRRKLGAKIDVPLGDDGKKRYKFSDGAVTIKEVINKSWGIFNTAGILAQFKVVGTWEAFPIEALPAKPAS